MPSYSREHSDGTAVYKGGSTETIDQWKDVATGFASGLVDEAAYIHLDKDIMLIEIYLKN